MTNNHSLAKRALLAAALMVGFYVFAISIAVALVMVPVGTKYFFDRSLPGGYLFVAAAMGAPTLTLFGPTDERVRAPYGPRTRTLRGRSLEAIAAAQLDDARAMEDVSIDAVEAAALELLHAGGLR